MHSELLPYYNQELEALRQLSREFASQFPKVAGRLLLEEGVSEDPHVERLMEAFSFLTARIHQRLDDEFSEITDALLGILYPHYLRPIPSMSIVQFKVDPTQTALSGKLFFPRHTQLLSRRVQDMPCRFRTAYPVELWPIFVSSARMDTLSQTDFAIRQQATTTVLHLCLQTYPGQLFNDLGIERLRFFLQGAPSAMLILYEVLFHHVQKISVRIGETHLTLPVSAICAIGFQEEEGLLDYDSRSSKSYRLLHEYFVFPDKFMFFELQGLNALVLPSETKIIEFIFHIDASDRTPHIHRLAGAVTADNFRLGCVPVVNLFKQNAEPLQITHTKTAYQIIPDIRRPWGVEIYSVDSVKKLNRIEGQASADEYRPFFGLHHADTNSEESSLFWLATRKPATRAQDKGSEVHLSLIDLNFNPSKAAQETLSIQLTCTNRDLPGLLPFGGEQGDFEIEQGSPVSQIYCLKKPTTTLRPSMGRSAVWKLISHLSLNYLSIVDDNGTGTQAFRELLNLYNFSQSAVMRKQIAGIVKISSQPTLAKWVTCGQMSFVRGIEIILELDEEAFDGSVYLFSSIIERFLALYAAINSFTKVVVRTQQSEHIFKTWPPRSGKTVLL